MLLALACSCSVASVTSSLREPMNCSHQVPLSTGFSRQEYQSGLPCPSPEDLPDPGTEPKSPAFQTDSSPTEPPEKPLKVKVKVGQSCPTLCDSMDSMEFSRPEYWSRQSFPSPGDLPSLGIKPRSPTLQADSLPAESQAKPKNTRVGSLSLLQRIFLTQESNWGLLHCRHILYQLSYQGSPEKPLLAFNDI